MGLFDLFPFQFILKMPESLRDFFIVKKIEELDQKIIDRKKRSKYSDLICNTPDFVYYKEPKLNKEKGKPVNFAIEELKVEIEELEKQRIYYRSLLSNRKVK
jgi:hypothetical protein